MKHTQKKTALSVEASSYEDEFKRYLQGQGLRKTTAHGYYKLLRQYLNWLKSQHITPLSASYVDLLAYVNHMRAAGNSPHTQNQKLQSVKQFYNWQTALYNMLHNPVDTLRIKGTIHRQPHDLLSYDTLESLYANCPAGGLIGKRNKMMLGLVIYQGLRTGELSALETYDVKLSEATISVPSVGRSSPRILKLAAHQILPMQAYLSEVRPAILKTRGAASEKLFMSQGISNDLQNSLYKLMQKLKPLEPNLKTMQQIRSSVISHWLKHEHIREVQYKAGHRYVSSTEHYHTKSLDTLQEQLETMHPLQTAE